MINDMFTHCGHMRAGLLRVAILMKICSIKGVLALMTKAARWGTYKCLDMCVHVA